MFPFKPRKTRWEIARNTVLDAAHDAADIASHAATVAAVKAGTAATSATIAGKHILENVEDKLQHSLHNSGETAQNLKENLSDSLTRGAHVADQRAHQALERAQETAHSARETAQSARETAAAKAAAQRKALEHKKDDLAHALHDKSEHAREVAAQTAARLGRKREEVAENVANVAENTRDAKRSWFQRGSEVVDEASENAHKLAEQKSDAASEAAQQSRKEIRRQAKEAKKQAEKDAARLAREKEPSEDVRVEIEEGGSSAMWIVIGIAVGAVVALLLWPKVGRRNRAALQDKFSEVKESATETVHNVADKAADKAEDLSRRADGLAHEVHVAATNPVGTDNPVPETTADDITIADRVRSELGQTVLGEEIFLNIDSVEGNVSVRGALPDMTTQIELEAMIRAIPGVRDVIFDTPAPDAPPLEDSLNHQTEIAERAMESHLADAVEQPKNESPADEPFVG